MQVEKVTLHVCLADFGLAHIISGTHGVGTATMKAGTPGFQAPAQLRGDTVGTDSDVYALGVVIVELFGEKALWGTLSSHAIMYKVGIEGKFPEYGHLPEQIQTVVALCFCKQQERKTVDNVLKKMCNVVISS